MPDIASSIDASASNAWFLLPTAVLLGALHALEPGHSKSMMTAFIVAIHGTASQAALLAVSSTIGHTIVVWILALAAWRLGDSGFLERAEPWLLLFGGILIVVLAFRMLFRIESPISVARIRHEHVHDHIHGPGDHDHPHDDAHSEAYEIEDAHAAAHAAEIKKRFTGGPITNADVIWFGFSGGLLPCPAAFAVLLACLHQKAYAFGLVMVAAFSIGLAAMLVAVGVLAAWGAEAIKSRASGLGRLTKWAPLLSAIVVLIIGTSVAAEGARNFGLISLHTVRWHL